MFNPLFEKVLRPRLEDFLRLLIIKVIIPSFSSYYLNSESKDKAPKISSKRSGEKPSISHIFGVKGVSIKLLGRIIPHRYHQTV